MKSTAEAPRLLGGGASVCAQARLGTGRFALTCHPVASHPLEGAHAGPRSWATEELVRLRPATGGHNAPFREGWLERWGGHSLPDVVATGARRDGRWVAFRRDASKPELVDLPALGSHGAIIELQYDVSIDVPSGPHCADAWSATGDWIARTSDGALLVADGPSVWRELIAADAGSFVTFGGGYCAVVGDLDVRCGPMRGPGWAYQALDALRQPDQSEVKVGGGLACARSRTGTVRCARVWDGSPVGLLGPTARIVAMGLGPDDACFAEADGSWWCARGPNDEPMPREPRGTLELRPVAELAGAVGVALTSDGGCARMRDGKVSCWGRAWRWRPGGEVAEIEGIRHATAISAGREYGCAIDRGRVRCWDFSRRDGAVRRRPPFEVPVGAPARLVAVGERRSCAAGESEIWCWPNAPALDLPSAPTTSDIVRGVVTGAPRSLLADRDSWWLSTDRAEGWRLDAPTRAPAAVTRVRWLDGGDALGRVGDSVCALRDGLVLRCGARWIGEDLRALEGRHLSFATVEALEPPPEIADRGPTERPPCRLEAGGGVACQIPGGTPEAVRGVPRARMVSASDSSSACAVSLDGRVFCWGHLYREALANAASDLAPRMVPFSR